MRCKTLAARGREHIAAGRPRFPASSEDGHRLTAAFHQAAVTGDIHIGVDSCAGRVVSFEPPWPMQRNPTVIASAMGQLRRCRSVRAKEMTAATPGGRKVHRQLRSLGGIRMTRYFGALTLVLMLGIVLTRVFLLRQQGIQAMKFGNIDKTDFFITPFALLYFYVVLAAAFNWPAVNKQEFFHSEIISWTGVLFCFAGLLLLLWSERRSYIAAATWLFHRQVLREEDYLRQHYGQAYMDYCNRVRRYL
jgi:protein-S-isoprenylcysteine O-methyltransferase Ste14